MAVRKSISNTFVVTAVEDGVDGVSDQQIFKQASAYPYSGAAPTGGSGDDDVPTGWSRDFPGVSESMKYCYASTRRKINGAWTTWSTPALHTKWADDGTSITIKGTVNGVIARNGYFPVTPSADNVGDMYLRNNNVQYLQEYEDYVVCEQVAQDTYDFVGHTDSEIGDGYLYNGELWQKVREESISSSQPRWQNVGNIKGPKGDKGDDGESPYFADLDNEMDGVLCDQSGTVKSESNIYTNVKLFMGNTQQEFSISQVLRNGTEITVGTASNNVTVIVTSDGLSKTLRVQYAVGATISTKDDFTITCELTSDSTITRTLHLTVNGIRGNAIYRLVPSVSQIIKRQNNSYVPSGNVTCAVTKVMNGSESTPASSEYSLKVILNGGTEADYATSYSTGVPVGNVTSNIVFILRYPSTNVIIDRETVPLVKDGVDGEDGDDGIDAVTATATPDIISVPCNSNGSVKSYTSKTVSVTMLLGETSFTPTQLRISSVPNGVNIFDGTSSNGIITVSGNSLRFSITTIATASGISSGIVVTAVGTLNGTAYSAKCTIGLAGMLQGETGASVRGKTGRFFYYAGDWSEAYQRSQEDGDIYFLVNDAQAPYFSYVRDNVKRYAVYSPDEEIDSEMEPIEMSIIDSNGLPDTSTEGTGWKVMTDDFKYLITEAIFAQFAHLGSFIISGDYLISQYGTLYNGLVATIINADNYQRFYGGALPYTYFDGNDPCVDTLPSSGTYKFRPAKCIDALTGAEHMANGNVRVDADGNVTMNNATIQGSLMFRKVLTEYNYNYIEVADSTTTIHTFLKADTFIIGKDYSVFNVAFPPAYLFPGAQIKIVVACEIYYDIFINRKSGEEAMIPADAEAPGWPPYNCFYCAVPMTDRFGSAKQGRQEKLDLSTTQYHCLELVSVQGFESGITGYYFWMIVNAE